MARVNQPFLSFNRGLLSPKALGRVDLDRTRLSAEVYTNFLPKTQGALTIRPGTKYMGSSFSDTGAEFIEFVAATDDVALVELTHQKMRVWLGDDAHALELLSRPHVDTTVSFTDTGWNDASTGGTAGVSAVDSIPVMSGPTTSGVTITASSESGGNSPWHVGDNNNNTEWWNAADNVNLIPSQLIVDFGSPKSIASYTIRASNSSGRADSAPERWQLQGNDVDTGTGWVTEDTQGSETGWGAGERRTYTLTDTGTPGPWRYWRLNVTDVSADIELIISEIEMFAVTGSSKLTFGASGLTMNASARGAIARARKRVVVDTGDIGVEHSLAIGVERGPVIFRVGSTAGDDDYVSEASLGTGNHNLAFTPQGDFHITFQSSTLVNRIVSSIAVGDSGVVEVEAPWEAADLDNVRYDQSADVVFVDCIGVRPSKIERRGTGRSWSVVDYLPTNGPFLPSASSSAKMKPNAQGEGNSSLESDTPYFTPGHVGALFRLFHEGQSGIFNLGAKHAATDPVEITGISDDTGTPDANSERRIVFGVSGSWAGSVTIERSIDGPDLGFKPISASISTPTDTGTFTKTIDDPDDNLSVWYRAKITSYISGVAQVVVTYPGGGTTGIARVTGYNSNTSVDYESLTGFARKGDTGFTDNWQEGYWSDARGFPTAVALHSGRLFHAQGGSLFGSVSDDYENFDQDTVGDARPIIRTFGSGPVDRIHYLASLLRLIIGTTGAELALTSSSLDEPPTAANSSARGFATQGSANVRAVKMDSRAIMVQRSRQRIFMVGPGGQGTAFGDYEAFELTLLVPDLLAAGVVSVAIQRQPDTRIHCVLADGRVGILTYEPQEEVICWSMWETDGFVERASVLPGVSEDAVFYHVRRAIGGANDAFTKVLLHFEGADQSALITDGNAGGSAHVWTANGDAQLDRGERKFGRSSLLLDGTGDYISTPDHADFALGSSDFTIDGWFNCNAASGSVEWLAGQVDTGFNGSLSAWDLGRQATNLIRFEYMIGSTFASITGTTQFTNAVNTGWHHVAVTRSGTALRLFIDGVLEASATISGAINDSSVNLGVGSLGTYVSDPWTGHIDEFRLSVGIARWTANFTPPSVPTPPTNVRYLEKWAMESECIGDTGLTWIMDCAKSYTDTGRTATLTGFNHIAGKRAVVWSSDTGSFPGVDRSPDVSGVQTLYTVDTGTGEIELSVPVHHAVVGLPFTADWKSTKLAYAAEAGTALVQMKRSDKIGFVLHETHNNGIFFGRDSGNLDPLPRSVDGAVVDADLIHGHYDKAAMPFPGLWDTDSRIHLRGRAPRPATVLAAVPTIATNEKV